MLVNKIVDERQLGSFFLVQQLLILVITKRLQPGAELPFIGCRSWLYGDAPNYRPRPKRHSLSSCGVQQCSKTRHTAQKKTATEAAVFMLIWSEFVWIYWHFLWFGCESQKSPPPPPPPPAPPELPPSSPPQASEPSISIICAVLLALK